MPDGKEQNTEDDGGSERDDDSGRFVSNLDQDPQDVLEFMEPGEPYVTGELADALDRPHRTMYSWLADLEVDDKIKKIKKNERTVIWIKTTRGD